jgi:hypothetical protein
MEDCGDSLGCKFLVVFSEVAEGVQMSHVADSTVDGAVG